MRMMIEARARRDFEYRNTYNRALVGRFHNDLGDGPYRELHEDDDIGLFSFTGPFPERDAEKGDERGLMFASHDPNHAAAVARNLCTDPELNIRGMDLRVVEAFAMDPRVGERGELTTGTPIILRFGDDYAEEYGVDSKYDRTYWRPKHGMPLFWELLNGNLQAKYRLAFEEEPPEPPYFEGFELERTVAKPLLYDGNEVPHVSHEFTFEYEVQSAAHRKLLNLALDAGLGGLNGTGFGFMNRVEDMVGSDEEGVYSPADERGEREREMDASAAPTREAET